MKSPWSKYTLDVRLNKQEKDALRDRVLAYMAYHPINTTTPSTQHTRFIFDTITTHTRILASVAMVMVVALITTPLLAENAKPGELLYAVKTKVNEQIRSITLATPTEKIVFETKLLEKRVAEVQLLVETGELNEDAELDLSKNIKKHSENIQKSINEMKEQNVDEAEVAQVELSATLTTTNTLVSSLTSTGEEKETGMLKKVVGEIRENAAAKVASSTEISGEKVVLHVEQELSKAYELRASIDDQLTAEDAEEITKRFKSIETMVRTRAATSTNEVNTTSTVIIVKPTADEILANIKTLVIYMNNTAIRSLLPKTQENPLVEIIEITPATSTQITEENNERE